MKKLAKRLNAALLLAGTVFLASCDDSTGVVVDVCFVVSQAAPARPFCRCYKAADGAEYILKIETCDGFTAFSESDATQIYERLVECQSDGKKK